MQKYDVSADRARTPPEGTSTVESEVDFLIANAFGFYQHVPMQDRTRKSCMNTVLWDLLCVNASQLEGGKSITADQLHM